MRCKRSPKKRQACEQRFRANLLEPFHGFVRLPLQWLSATNRAVKDQTTEMRTVALDPWGNCSEELRRINECITKCITKVTKTMQPGAPANSLFECQEGTDPSGVRCLVSDEANDT
mmetsp:Transcript_70150/g.117745  ORF Transcript_70150/g.117745 Transcript_70150/m.117745 type:complete len:116 (-) Transcript_70150:71-418(-)